MFPGCGDTHPSDIPNVCAQPFWSAFVPGLLVLIFGLAEMLLDPAQSRYNGHGDIQFLLTFIAVLEFLPWVTLGIYVVASNTGLGVISTMPLKIPPDDHLRDNHVVGSLEGYASIFEWVTYSWMYSVIKVGNTREMEPEDVWDLSSAMQSKSIFIKFMATEYISGPNCRQDQSGLSRTVGHHRVPTSHFTDVANRSDLLLDILLTIVTVLLSYAAPFFLHQVLYLIENPSREDRSKACVLALKGEADAQHLFFSGKRALARVNTQLIYD